MSKNFATEKINNLPDEFKNSARFFPVGTPQNPKAPKIKEWSNPNNQTFLTQIDGLAGFDTCGHDNGADYCFLDFDHVLNSAGAFVNDSVSATVADLQATFPNVYLEKSISGHGLHAFLKPTADKFNALSAGSKGTIYFSNSHDKNAPKIELFYKSKGRYCLVTGDIFGTGADIPADEPADDYLNKLLNAVASQAKKKRKKRSY